MTNDRCTVPVRVSDISVSKARWQVMTDDRSTCESVCQVSLQCYVVVDDEIVPKHGREEGLEAHQ